MNYNKLNIPIGNIYTFLYFHKAIKRRVHNDTPLFVKLYVITLFLINKTTF